MADRNVQAFLRREAEIGQAQAHVRNLSEATHQALWADTQAKRGNTQAEKARQDKRVAGEMEQASREVKARRSERLRMLYAALEARYEQELAEKGMAFIRNRD
jgi:hypothetical protein